MSATQGKLSSLHMLPRSGDGVWSDSDLCDYENRQRSNSAIKLGIVQVKDGAL
jgi:hypothetical protein